MPTINPTTRLQQVTPRFNLEPLKQVLQNPIAEALKETGQNRYHASTILIPAFVIWVVLAMTLRRDLNTHQVLEWALSGLKWMDLNLVAGLISEGALSHARVRVGEKVFELIFRKLTASVNDLEPDFHGLITVIFDGTTMDMPDTQANRTEFGKPRSGHSEAAFPQMRVMALLAPAARIVLELACGPYVGKGTGERTLMQGILDQITRKGLLYLFDAGFYSFLLAFTLTNRDEAFVMKISSQVGVKKLPDGDYRDGSYLGEINGKVKGKRKRLIVRVIDFQFKGFRPCRLITNLLDKKITAREIIRQYHKRWDIEIAFDEIKTHQCARLRGQAPTVLRSKRPDLVRQELWAIVISYNTVRQLMRRAANEYDKEVTELSFLDTLQQIIDAIPIISCSGYKSKKQAYEYLLYQIAHCEIDRPRRGRVNPRVIKIQTSKFKRKTGADKGELRDFEKDLSILVYKNIEAGSDCDALEKAA